MSEKNAKLEQASEINEQISQLDYITSSIFKEKFQQSKTLQNLQCIQRDLISQLQSGFDINEQIMLDFCNDMIQKQEKQIAALDHEYFEFGLMKQSLIEDWRNLMDDDENKKQEATA